MTRPKRRYSLRDDWNSPGTRAQTLSISGMCFILGVLVMTGGAGTETWVKLLGALIFVMSGVLFIFTVRRMRRAKPRR